MTVAVLAFYLFAAVTVAAAAMVITARNAVHSVLFLILAFLSAAGLFVLAGAEFLAMILAIVYVGAVAVLFMFVVMMLDIDFARVREGVLRYLPVGGTIGLVLLVELGFVVAAHPLRRRRACAACVPRSPPAWPRARGPTNAEHAWGACSTPTIFTCSRPPGWSCSWPMIGAIALSLRERSGVRRQKPARPGPRGGGRGRPSRFRKVPPGTGSCRAMEIALSALSRRRGDPLRARHFRRLPQPQERHRHPHVDRADAACGQHQSRRLFEPISTTWRGRSSPCSCSPWPPPKCPSASPSSSVYNRLRGNIEVEDLDLMKG